MNEAAFPSHVWDKEYERYFNTGGMTLRDYFAAKVLQGMLASGNLPKTMPDADIAECSYNLADAMLKAREA